MFVVCVSLGLLALVVLWPRVSVDFEGIPNPSQPWNASFKIANTGFIPLVDVQPLIGLCEIIVEDQNVVPQRCNGRSATRFAIATLYKGRLVRDEGFSFLLDDVFRLAPGATLTHAEISVGIDYQPWFVPYHRTADFKFGTRRENDGRLTWETK
jgi:hypothetical protein